MFVSEIIVIMTFLPFFLFLLGISFGSFLNVLSFRYNPNKSIFSRKILGRSYCSSCKRHLRFFELVPLLSFIFLRGKCRTCRARLSFQYPIVELSSGLSFIFLPEAVSRAFELQFMTGSFQVFVGGILYVLFGLAILTLIFIAAVDSRIFIIPDESNALIAIIGVVASVFVYISGSFDVFSGSFVGHYASLFGFHSFIVWNRLFAVFIAFISFGFIFFTTRGRGMGFGDVKLSVVLGFLLGWPDLVLALMIAFITGSLWSILMMVCRKKKFSSRVPFGPFIVLGALLIMFFGVEIMNGYFALFP